MFTAFKRLKAHHQKIFSVIIGTALIMFWRGIWGLLDLYFLPKNAGLSFLLSAIIGLGILATCHVMIKELT